MKQIILAFLKNLLVAASNDQLFKCPVRSLKFIERVTYATIYPRVNTGHCSLAFIMLSHATIPCHIWRLSQPAPFPVSKLHPVRYQTLGKKGKR